MTASSKVTLADVTERAVSGAPSTRYSDAFPYIDIDAIDRDNGEVRAAKDTFAAAAPSRARQFVSAGDIVVSTVRPNLRQSAMVPTYLEGAVASTGFCVLRPTPDVEGRYLFHFVRSDTFVQQLVRLCRGAQYPAVTDSDVRALLIPLPPLEHQRRIATALDRAARIMKLHRQAAAKTRALISSLFVETFGDPATNPYGWPTPPLRQLITEGPMNGISPSTRSTVPRAVLTLSAITGVSFNEEAVKVGTFEKEFDGRRSVRRSLFLVCRGNGNRELVGRGYFPTMDMADTYFPDTMIGFGLDATRLDNGYFEALWSTEKMREAVFSTARTTNGTYKINQEGLCSICVPLPNHALQVEFARKAGVIASALRLSLRAVTQAGVLQAGLLNEFFGDASL